MSRPKVATIGDRNQDGTLEITDTSWNGNGTLQVTVRDLVGTSGSRVGGFPIRQARTLARRALMYPDQTRSSRVVRSWDAQGSAHVTIAVSRKKP